MKNKQLLIFEGLRGQVYICLLKAYVRTGVVEFNCLSSWLISPRFGFDLIAKNGPPSAMPKSSRRSKTTRRKKTKKRAMAPVPARLCEAARHPAVLEEGIL